MDRDSESKAEYDAARSEMDAGNLAAATALNRQARAPSLLAEALHAIGELDRAREVAEAVLERDPGNRRARVILEAS